MKKVDNAVLMCSAVAPNRHSGVGNVEHDLITGLRAQKVRVKEFFPHLKRSVSLTDFYYGLRLKEQAAGCDVIHCHTDMSWNTPGAFRTFHGVSALGEAYYRQERAPALIPRHKQALYFGIHKALEKRCAKYNYCIAVSDYVRSALIEYYGAKPENTVTLYNGIDASFFKPDAKHGREFRKQNGLAEGDFVLSWVG